MASNLQNEYEPDSVSAPGETLLETLETLGISQEELATRMGHSTKTINEIIQKRAAITAEIALQLEQVLHIPASFWLKREQNYRESLDRLSEEQQRKNSA
ncbi:MAG TPA: HigA family addiction module antitoxin [Ktedonobacteraceae bacterium]|nr:HigA family addiction module antitoxin [Ktedonobacteraceae bacterium]HEV2659530.1 HigA family addiction module antitoxin [Ktedonobacteraceae bacterium]